MLDKLTNSIDFIFAFAVIHEIPDRGKFFGQISAATKLGTKLLLAEQKRVVSKNGFNEEITFAEKYGFKIENDLKINGMKSLI